MLRNPLFAGLLLVVATATAGCAGINREGGAGGGEVVSGETVSESSRSGSAYDDIATSGSNPADPVTGPPRADGRDQPRSCRRAQLTACR